METPDDLTSQLREELSGQIGHWALLAGAATGRHLHEAINTELPHIAHGLAAGTAPPGTAQAIVAIIWCGQPPTAWWQTPAGRACAAQLAPHAQGTVTYAVAAAMLGVTRGTVQTLVQRERLTRVAPGNSICLASVLNRIATQNPSPKKV